MKAENLNVLFYTNKAKTNQKGHCSIYCRITFNKVRKQFSTGNSINPKDWNSKKQLAESKQIDYTVLNGQLSLIKQKINNIYFKLQIENVTIKVDDIIDSYFQKPSKKEDSVISYLNKDLDKLKKLIGKDLKQSTWNKFNYAYNDVASFIKFAFKQKDIPLNELNLNFLEELEYYLKTEKNNKQVTLNKTIQRFRKPIKNAISEGYLDKDPFLMYKASRVKKEIIFLTSDELNKLENYSFEQTRLNQVRDLFIFCCYTGLAYNEMVNLKSENISIGFDNMEWIQMKREKTSKQIAIPILPKAKYILNKYENSLPKLSNQKVNSYLKEIAAIVGINKNITHHIARKTFASTVLLYNNVPMEIVSELLGHSNMTITQESYGQIVKEKVSDAMINLSKKMNDYGKP
ncbi:site-specific integrase [Flavobacterium sp.]|jgi:integrase/recombinase XerD|uniref:site-specific integrase n=1 Tax=Flavobacterium sp. TaxID=239 RepID=UPI0037BFC694